MPQPRQQAPAIPDQPVQQGSRWRYHRPPAEDVAAWFSTQPLDDGMKHEDFIGGVVLIPQNEKIKFTLPNGNRGERFEEVFTPYVQAGTRVAYFHRLAEHRELISVIAAAPVPVIDDRTSAFYNANMEAGYWWHIVRGEGDNPVRFLCCTMRVALYEREAWLDEENHGPPLLEGRSTKQVSGGPDINQLGKAQTGAIGRALGVAGILTLGTGVATAEDMQELAGPTGTIPSADEAQLPADAATEAPAADPDAELAKLRARAVELQSKMQAEAPHGWRNFAAWWQLRSKEEGWTNLEAVPAESLKGVIARMEREHAEALKVPNPAEAEANGSTEDEA